MTIDDTGGVSAASLRQLDTREVCERLLDPLEMMADSSLEEEDAIAFYCRFEMISKVYCLLECCTIFVNVHVVRLS